MTKILVVSDTHGNKSELKKLILDNPCDYTFFLGDTTNDIDDVKKEIEIPNLYIVKGNWDIGFKYKTREYLKIDDIKILLVHGHGLDVKNNLNTLIDLAKKEKVDLVCYGHTHIQRENIVDEIVFVNPGAYSNFKGGQYTFAVIQIDNKKISVNMLKKIKIIC